MGFPVLDTEDFFNKSQSGKHTLVDARSESEFAHAHIPGAINIPILNDEERKLVGTEYKTNGREAAVLLGFKLVGPRFHQIIKEAQSAASSNNLLIYCWRGGMRSQILSWLLSLNGFRIELLKGGYKSFRNLVINTNASKRSYIVLGGPTGSGKTEVLNHLPIHGEQILDLEYLANHKGSAFGGLGKSGQPSNEQFENLIGIHLMKMKNENVIWIENESRSIGKCIIPEGLYTQIRESVVFTMDVPIHIRRNRIKNEYGNFSNQELTEMSEKIKKRMGPQNLKSALDSLSAGNFDGWLEPIMEYYDRLYAYGNTQRDPNKVIKFETDLVDLNGLAKQMINKKYNISHD